MRAWTYCRGREAPIMGLATLTPCWLWKHSTTLDTGRRWHPAQMLVWGCLPVCAPGPYRRASSLSSAAVAVAQPVSQLLAGRRALLAPPAPQREGQRP